MVGGKKESHLLKDNISLEDFADTDIQIDRLKETCNRLSNQLIKAKHTKSELVEAVYKAASDAANSFDFPPTLAPKVDPRVQGEEVAIAVLSDWQLAKVTLS